MYPACEKLFRSINAFVTLRHKASAEALLRTIDNCQQSTVACPYCDACVWRARALQKVLDLQKTDLLPPPKAPYVQVRPRDSG